MEGKYMLVCIKRPLDIKEIKEILYPNIPFTYIDIIAANTTITEEIIQLMIDRKVKFPIITLMKNRRLTFSMAKLLLKQKCYSSRKRNRALIELFKHPFTSKQLEYFVKRFIDYKWDWLDPSGSTILQSIAENRSLTCDILKLTLKKNWDKDALRSLYVNPSLTSSMLQLFNNKKNYVGHYCINNPRHTIDVIKYFKYRYEKEMRRRDKHGRTPVYYLCKHFYVTLEKLKLIIKLFRIDNDIVEGIFKHKIIPNGMLEMILESDLYLTRELEIDSRFTYHISNDNWKKIAEKGWRIKDEEGNTPLHIYVKRALTLNPLFLTSIMGNEWNVQNKKGNTPVYYLREKAITLTNIKILKRANWDIGEEATPIHMISKSRITEDIFDELKGYDWLKKDNSGITPLHYLCKNPRLTTGLLKRVLNKSTTITTDRDETLLHYLCLNPKIKVELIEIVKDSNDWFVLDKRNKTPLNLLQSNPVFTVDMLEVLIDKYVIKKNSLLDFLRDDI